jgi:hypothetical protein
MPRRYRDFPAHGLCTVRKGLWVDTRLLCSAYLRHAVYYVGKVPATVQVVLVRLSDARGMQALPSVVICAKSLTVS